MSLSRILNNDDDEPPRPSPPHISATDLSGRSTIPLHGRVPVIDDVSVDTVFYRGTGSSGTFPVENGHHLPAMPQWSDPPAAPWHPDGQGHRSEERAYDGGMSLGPRKRKHSQDADERYSGAAENRIETSQFRKRQASDVPHQSPSFDSDGRVRNGRLPSLDVARHDRQTSLYDEPLSPIPTGALSDSSEAVGEPAGEYISAARRRLRTVEDGFEHATNAQNEIAHQTLTHGLARRAQYHGRDRSRDYPHAEEFRRLPPAVHVGNGLPEHHSVETGKERQQEVAVAFLPHDRHGRPANSTSTLESAHGLSLQSRVAPALPIATELASSAIQHVDTEASSGDRKRKFDDDGGTERIKKRRTERGYADSEGDVFQVSGRPPSPQSQSGLGLELGALENEAQLPPLGPSHLGLSVEDMIDELVDGPPSQTSHAGTPLLSDVQPLVGSPVPSLVPSVGKKPRGLKKMRLVKEEKSNTPMSFRNTSLSIPTSHQLPSIPSRPGSPDPLYLPQSPPRHVKKYTLEMASKRAKVVDDNTRRVWKNIAVSAIPKAHRFYELSVQAHDLQTLRMALACRKERPKAIRSRNAKENTAKSKRIMKEMLTFWKQNERAEKEERKKAERAEAERARVEDEKREQQRQQRKLNFLITQTELYSHFVGSKLKAMDAEDSETTQADGPTAVLADTTASVTEEEADPGLEELNFEDEDESNLLAHAAKNARDALDLAKQKADAFDADVAQRRTEADVANEEKGIRDDEFMNVEAKELNFQNPTMLQDAVVVEQPALLDAKLKDYQLKGLNWLVQLYEQGINGILADEMGLGKTVQSISLLAYLAEKYDIWGPFLVIAPASTLHNWEQEIRKFVPRMKVLPYWGVVKDRQTLRKFWWNRKKIKYNESAPFHVLVTSYQMVLADAQYFQSVKWQYMILDEAQAIKSSSSARWQTLLNFTCRNRLLLTGTPIQNSMQELWALLHFIMPSLFDSHEEFSEWFSKDIENAAENKSQQLNQTQLKRLHMILKPFMLRRIKKNVQSELGEKIEIDLYVEMSPKQSRMHKAIRSNISVSDLLTKAATSEEGIRTLMNLVMQFRKVCNHPELFERADVVSPFAFVEWGQSDLLSYRRDTRVFEVSDSARNPIVFPIPDLLYREGGLLRVPGWRSQAGSDTHWLYNLMNIWKTDVIEGSLARKGSAYAVLPLIDMSSEEAHHSWEEPTISRLTSAACETKRAFEMEPYLFEPDLAAHSIQPLCVVRKHRVGYTLHVADRLPPLHAIRSSFWEGSFLSRAEARCTIDRACAPPPALYADDRPFIDAEARFGEGYSETLALYGLPPSLLESRDAADVFQHLVPGVASPEGIIAVSDRSQLPQTQMRMPDMKRLIYDSAKLARLDALLRELKEGDHRVLIYSQMTRMIDLLEEYLIYRQFKYLRLDGTSKISDRRDMVEDWQTRPDIFVFLLSTRAGGLGINLTAADTVIFYDSDWNPSNDAQAMDRAHRLGQTRQVTVYRLVVKGTIDERIVQMARVKKDVQDIVVGNKQFVEVAGTNEIVNLLLSPEELAQSMDRLKAQAAAEAVNSADARRRSRRAANNGSRDLWQDDGDDDTFFNQTPAANGDFDFEEDDTQPAKSKKPVTEKQTKHSAQEGKGKRKYTKRTADSGAAKKTQTRRGQVAQDAGDTSSTGIPMR
ncbi:hypothetical protein CALCODRAFT_498534 [Calocera cornea HHB12733]|uniref:Chromatin-remodeling ATPase INO80 n=1 Tax=Calocera cornea HHB12733 TaxID=1353952 RepID=A0A165EU14_9BASI|nr:hypothetical protein CALCODRAFT_498534 [Calocera cornea HHB12733]